MFQRILLNIKYNNSIFVKCFHHSHNVSFWSIHENAFPKNKMFDYSSIKQDFSRRENISMHQEMHSNILKGPLLCKTTPVLASTISKNHGFTVNNSRQYSTIPPIPESAVAYSDGIGKVISESVPVEWAMEALKILYAQTGLPWWTIIILTTCLTEVLITLPLSILKHQNRAKINNMKHELTDVAKQLAIEAQMSVQSGEMNKLEAILAMKQALKQERKEIYKRDNCHPFKNIIITLLQTPIWISFSFALRNICTMSPNRDEAAYQTYLEFTTGGFGYMKDLTMADPIFLLPSILLISKIVSTEIFLMLYDAKETKWSKYFNRFLMILFTGVVAILPSSIALFWTTHDCCSTLLSLLLLFPKFRRLGRIPKTDYEYPHPYLELYKRLKGKVGLNKTE